MLASYNYSQYDLNISPIILHRSSNSYSYPIFIIHTESINDKKDKLISNIKKSCPSNYNFSKSITIDCLKPSFNLGKNTFPIVDLSNNPILENTIKFINKDKVPEWVFNILINEFIEKSKGCIILTDNITYLAPSLLARSILSVTNTLNKDTLKWFCNKSGSGIETIPLIEGDLEKGYYRGVHKGVHWSKYVCY